VTSGMPTLPDGTIVPNDLTLAARNAVHDLVRWLQAERSLSFAAAYTLASVAADLRIAQLVNDPSPTVTCTLPFEVFDVPPTFAS